jgi:hypothetical protein
LSENPHDAVIVRLTNTGAHCNSQEIGFVEDVQPMKYSEPGLLEGFVLCLWDSEFIRTQTSKWKRKLLVFSSGVCLEIAGAPLVGASLGYDFTWLFWLVSFLFLPMGLLGIYASKFGTDRLVERLLVVPQLDLKI